MQTMRARLFSWQHAHATFILSLIFYHKNIAHYGRQKSLKNSRPLEKLRELTAINTNLSVGVFIIIILKCWKIIIQSVKVQYVVQRNDKFSNCWIQKAKGTDEFLLLFVDFYSNTIAISWNYSLWHLCNYLQFYLSAPTIHNGNYDFYFWSP